MRTAVARACLVLSAALGLWALWLVVAGGFEVSLGGVSITTNEPLRPLLLASVAFAGFTAANGAARTRDRLARILARVDDRAAAGLLALMSAGIGLGYGTTVAGGADAYGYVSQADLWIEGDLKIPQPWAAEVPWPNPKWTFTPLGYRPLEGDGQWDLVPTYSPGLPLLMAGAKAIAGHAAVFWIVPLSGAVLTLATFGIGRRLGSSRAGLVAAWFVATSPIVIFMLMPPMTDVPVAAAWAAAFYFVLRPSLPSALAGGLVAALAVLIRPNLAPLAAILGVWLLIERQPGTAGSIVGRRGLARLGVFALGASPGAIVTALVYSHLYGSPLKSGYGGLDSMFSWSNVGPNAWNYLSWFVESQTWLPLAGLAVLIWPARRWWAWVKDRRIFPVLALFLLFIVVQYLTYLVFDTWWFLRFFIACWPVVMLGLAAVALAFAASPRPAVALLAVWGILALGVWNLHMSQWYGAFGAWIGEGRIVAVAKTVAERTSPDSVVLTLIHSGSLRYYGGRMTMRYDQVDSEWLDRSVRWLRERGIRTYALLEQWEIPEFKKRFSGQAATEALDRSLLFQHVGVTTIHFFELLPDGPLVPEKIQTDLTGLRWMPPAPRPVLVLK